MTLINFPFNVVPYVRLPVATLLQDAPLVRQYIENTQVPQLQQLLSGYGLPPIQHVTAVEQFAVGLSLDRPLKESAYKHVYTVFYAFRSIEQNAPRE